LQHLGQKGFGQKGQAGTVRKAHWLIRIAAHQKNRQVRVDCQGGTGQVDAAFVTQRQIGNQQLCALALEGRQGFGRPPKGNGKQV